MSTMNPTDAVNVLKFLERIRANESNPEAAAMLQRVEDHLRFWVSKATSEPINDGGPAFPMQDAQAIHTYAAAAVLHIPAENVDERDRVYMEARAKAIGGASMRGYFAAKAMQAFIAGHIGHYGHENHWPYNQMASEAVSVADAMIKALKGGAS